MKRADHTMWLFGAYFSGKVLILIFLRLQVCSDAQVLKCQSDISHLSTIAAYLFIGSEWL